MHDPRIGRFLSIDPLAAKYAYNSPYAFAENSVIDSRELEGLEASDADLYYMHQRVEILKNGSAEEIKNLNESKVLALHMAVGIVTVFAGGPALQGTHRLLTWAIANPFKSIAIGGAVANAVDPDPIPKDYTPMIPGDEILGKMIGNAFRSLRNINPKIANAGFRAIGQDAPFDEMRQIVDFTIKNDEQFVRVFSSELGNKEGAWMMKAADVAGMTPGQIKDKYALDYVPDMMVDVTVAGGSTLRAGTAATREGIGAGGGTQFMATGRLSSESFTNERALGQ